MYTSILSATMQGIRAIPVQVEVDVSPGLPGFSMVGTVNSQVREAQDRVRTALHNLEIPVPPRRITINLSPAMYQRPEQVLIFRLLRQSWNLWGSFRKGDLRVS